MDVYKIAGLDMFFRCEPDLPVNVGRIGIGSAVIAVLVRVIALTESLHRLAETALVVFVHDPGLQLRDALRALARKVADAEGIPVQEGVYLGLKGPSFETAAEIRAFRIWGADTVAMSVCEEVIAARHVGMRVLGVSLISNMACGVGDADPCNDEVFEVAFRSAGNFARMVEGVLEQLPPFEGEGGE